jgi:hypothetical protein
MTRDPAVAVTAAPYSYTGGNPLNGADPTGLFCGGPLCGIVRDLGAAGKCLAHVMKCLDETDKAVHAHPDPQGGAKESGWTGAGKQMFLQADPTASYLFTMLLLDALPWGGLCAEAEAETGPFLSTGRSTARNLTEQLAMEQAKSNPADGLRLAVSMTDARWPGWAGWVKMGQNVNGVEIHYVWNTVTNVVQDWKFVGGVK